MLETNWPDLILKVVGLIAIPIGIVAFRLSWRAHQERSSFDMVDKMYSLCHLLQDHVQKTSYLAHLHCIDARTYYRTVDLIRSQTDIVKGNTKYRVEERQFAIRILMVYEQIYYQWDMTPESHHKRRKFLKSMMDYFVERLLPNPRMLAYLDSDPSGRTLHMEKDAADYLRSNVSRSGIVPDHSGPFEFDPSTTFY
jgi:hypothetical protein